MTSHSEAPSADLMNVTYWRPKYGGCREHAYAVDCNPESTVDEIAEAVAEDFHTQHYGWESKWPIEFAIVIDGAVHNVTVDREAVPSFHVVSHD